MTQEHPITPPPELVLEWWNQYTVTSDNLIGQFATQAARWGADQQLQLDAEQINQAWQKGADQELEACCEWMSQFNYDDYSYQERLRAARRRPKPPSHKELALIALTALEACAAQSSDTTESVFYIRRVLESLPD